MKSTRYELSGDVVLRYEPYFECKVPTAKINHELKEVRPSHGYFMPHPYGKLNKKLADRLGYSFNNN